MPSAQGILHNYGGHFQSSEFPGQNKIFRAKIEIHVELLAAAGNHSRHDFGLAKPDVSRSGDQYVQGIESIDTRPAIVKPRP